MIEDASKPTASEPVEEWTYRYDWDGDLDGGDWVVWQVGVSVEYDIARCSSHIDAEAICDAFAAAARERRLREALAEAAIPLEALHMAGGTGLTNEIADAVQIIRVALTALDAGEEEG